jgi:hypothetical protein
VFALLDVVRSVGIGCPPYPHVIGALSIMWVVERNVGLKWGTPVGVELPLPVDRAGELGGGVGVAGWVGVDGGHVIGSGDVA